LWERVRERERFHPPLYELIHLRWINGFPLPSREGK
jgi:hypothetical protein